jgi:hypothetical protein
MGWRRLRALAAAAAPPPSHKIVVLAKNLVKVACCFCFLTAVLQKQQQL